MTNNAINNLVVPKGIQNFQILNLEDSLIDLIRECPMTPTQNNLIWNCISNRLQMFEEVEYPLFRGNCNDRWKQGVAVNRITTIPQNTLPVVY